MTRVSLFASAAALTLLAGCGEAPPPVVNLTTVEVDNTTSITVPAGNAAEPATDNAVEANEAAAAPALGLAPDGLTIVLDSGSTRHANFDMGREMVVPMVSAALGKPAGTGRNEDCGQGPMDTVDFKGGLTLFFMDAKFVGWDVDGREKGGFTTLSGVGIGTTLKEMRESMNVTVETSTLGDEFSAGDIGGLLTSLKPDAKITHIWAGSICQFR